MSYTHKVTFKTTRFWNLLRKFALFLTRWPQGKAVHCLGWVRQQEWSSVDQERCFNDFSKEFGDVIESQDNYLYQPITRQFQSNTYMFKVTVATQSSPYPDQMVTAVTRIQSVSRSDGGSAPRDDLYSSECQRTPGHLD